MSDTTTSSVNNRCDIDSIINKKNELEKRAQDFNFTEGEITIAEIEGQLNKQQINNINALYEHIIDPYKPKPDDQVIENLSHAEALVLVNKVSELKDADLTYAKDTLEDMLMKEKNNALSNAFLSLEKTHDLFKELLEQAANKAKSGISYPELNPTRDLNDDKLNEQLKLNCDGSVFYDLTHQKLNGHGDSTIDFLMQAYQKGFQMNANSTEANNNDFINSGQGFGGKITISKKYGFQLVNTVLDSANSVNDDVIKLENEMKLNDKENKKLFNFIKVLELVQPDEGTEEIILDPSQETDKTLLNDIYYLINTGIVTKEQQKVLGLENFNLNEKHSFTIDQKNKLVDIATEKRTVNRDQNQMKTREFNILQTHYSMMIKLATSILKMMKDIIEFIIRKTFG